MSRRAMILCPMLALFIAGAAHAQGVPQVAAKAPSSEQLMKKWLRNLTTAQEAYYADHWTYTTDLAALGIVSKLTGPSAADSVHVRIFSANGAGWTGEATHRAARGRSCVIYIGDVELLPKVPVTRADRTAPADEGTPACDRQ